MSEAAERRRGRRGRAASEGWVVGRLVGVPVVLARSWFVIAAVITLLFAPAARRIAPELGDAAYLVAFGYAVLLLASVLVHELAHAVAARAVGMPASRIVLNLWGGHTQFETEAVSPGRSALVAVVGPLSNAVVGLLGWALYLVTGVEGLAAVLLLALAVTNGAVAVFNLVPGLPLDGGRVLEAGVWKLTGDRSTGMAVAGWSGRLVVVALVAWFGLRPLLAGQQPDLLLVVWVAVIGALLWQGAGEAIRIAAVRRRLEAATAAGLALPAVGAPSHLSVAQALELADGGRLVVLLGPDGEPVSVLDPTAVASVPAARRAVVSAATAARALEPGAVVDAGLRGTGMLTALSGLPGQEWAAVADGRVVGLLRSVDVVAAIRPDR